MAIYKDYKRFFVLLVTDKDNYLLCINVVYSNCKETGGTC